MYKGFIILLFGCALASCASQRHADISWEGHNVRVAITPPGASSIFTSPTIECMTCDEVLPRIPLDENAQGVAYFKLEAASKTVATTFRIRGAGLDTAVILQPPDPASATSQSSLATPVEGRILVTSLAHIYKDSTMSVPIGTLERGAEANLFRENDVFYFIYHPMYNHPVVVLRSNAIRLR